MVDYTIFSKNLRDMMDMQDMTNKELADLSGVSINMITAYRQNHSYPSSRVIQDIAYALNEDVGNFFRDDASLTDTKMAAMRRDEALIADYTKYMQDKLGIKDGSIYNLIYRYRDEYLKNRRNMYK